MLMNIPVMMGLNGANVVQREDNRGGGKCVDISKLSVLS